MQKNSTPSTAIAPSIIDALFYSILSVNVMKHFRKENNEHDDHGHAHDSHQTPWPHLRGQNEEKKSFSPWPRFWLQKLLDVYHENCGSSFMTKGTLAEDVERRSGKGKEGQILFWCRK